ncbi:MAG: phosphoribosylformylglycinamidine synthase subunit PurS [Rhodobacteraceae bacterium]|nr:phosphoribosylformylglycinamidine synthase subunit PurS [Paracoccaceae bacterium]
MKVQVYVTVKKGILDPQGEAVRSALERLGYNGVNEVRVGKLIELDLETDEAETARPAVHAMCTELLANSVIEDFDIKIP